MKKKILLSSMITIALCLCLIAGSTYALFTSKDQVSVAVTAGKVELEAYVDEGSMELYSIDQYMGDGVKVFQNGGTASVNAEGKLILERFTPGDKVTFDIVMENDSNIHIQYRVLGSTESKLAEVLNITSVEKDSNKTDVNQWSDWNTPLDNTQKFRRTTVTIELPTWVDNEYQTAEAEITIVVEAVQANGVDANGNLIAP